MPKPSKPTPELYEIELHPDAWDRFERGIKSMPRTPAQPKKAKPSRVKSTTRKRAKRA